MYPSASGGLRGVEVKRVNQVWGADIERLWRSLKYEEVYLKGCQKVPEARAGIGAYFRFYNQERPRRRWDTRHPGRYLRVGAH